MLIGKARDLGYALAGPLPLDPEAAGQLVAKVGLIDVAGGCGVVIDRRVVEAGPAAVRPLGAVGDEYMRVELGVAVSGGAVAVGGGEVSVAFDELRASGAAAGPAGVVLHVGEGGSYGLAVGGLDFEGGDGPAEAPEQGDRLGGGEGEIEAGDRAFAWDASAAEQRLAACRVRPVSIAVSWSGPISPSSPKCSAASPVHSPAVSPSPE